MLLCYLIVKRGVYIDDIAVEFVPVSESRILPTHSQVHLHFIFLRNGNVANYNSQRERSEIGKWLLLLNAPF